MAGSVVATRTEVPGTGVRKVSLRWTSDAAGAVSGNSVELPAGSLVAVAVKPDAGGTAPTDLYDVTLSCDEHSTGATPVDELGGLGANLSSTLSAHLVPLGVASSSLRRWLHGGGYTLVVANAGNAKSGLVDLYLSREIL